MRVINVYTNILNHGFTPVVLVLFYRFVHGKTVRHAYCNPYPASVRRLDELLKNRESTLSGDSGVLIQTFQFIP